MTSDDALAEGLHESVITSALLRRLSTRPDLEATIRRVDHADQAEVLAHITRYGRGVEDVRSLRDAAGLSQAELARRSGVAQPNLAAYETGRRRPSPEMITRLKVAMRPTPSEAARGRREEIVSVLASYGLTSPRVFGSVARGQDGPDSDLDLLVDIREDGDVLDLIDAAEELEELLGCRVEIVSARALRPGHEIERTAVPM